jgi:hypothetical protein
MKTKRRYRGEKYRPVVTVMKSKSGVPTAICVSGRRYQLNHSDIFSKGMKESGLRVI